MGRVDGGRLYYCESSIANGRRCSLIEVMVSWNKFALVMRLYWLNSVVWQCVNTSETAGILSK